MDQRETMKYFEMNESENTKYRNMWNATKAVFRGNVKL